MTCSPHPGRESGCFLPEGSGQGRGKSVLDLVLSSTSHLWGQLKRPGLSGHCFSEDVCSRRKLILLPLQQYPGFYPSTLGSLREAWATPGADSQREPLQFLPPPSLGAVWSGLSSVLILPLLALPWN